MMAVNLNLDFVWVPHLQAGPSTAWFHTHMQPPRRRSASYCHEAPCYHGLTCFQFGLAGCASCFAAVVVAPQWRYGRLALAVWLDSHVCPCPDPGHIPWQLTAVVATLCTLAVARLIFTRVRAARVSLQRSTACHGILADTLTPCGLCRWRRTGEMWHSESATSGKTSGSSTPWSAPSTSSGSTLC